MLIAFDLDDTIVPCGRKFPTAPPAGARRLLCAEPLRAGTQPLMQRLASAGHEIAVYTSSDRSCLGIRINFWSYGIHLAMVVSQTVHDRWSTRLPRGERAALKRCSKYPPAFGIDLLIDDSETIAAQGRALGYEVILVEPADRGWCDTILRAIGA